MTKDRWMEGYEQGRKDSWERARSVVKEITPKQDLLAPHNTMYSIGWNAAMKAVYVALGLCPEGSSATGSPEATGSALGIEEECRHCVNGIVPMSDHQLCRHCTPMVTLRD